ncbi:hypothetical protein D3800_00175 [Microcystis aeruginosa NIES-298]|uniref:hypothetical protein n=1 Tax=Microcystis aeruginosa TaxID=1126 RepID=UPI0010571A2F|nr:hypothetical protein [Microcystis aeruginosa]QHU81902.1 hypothetical protein D3800_00175 [Microcystis aeruginosa NIES-298]
MFAVICIYFLQNFTIPLLEDTNVPLTSTNLSPSKEETENKRPRRRRGEGSGLTTETKNLPKAF